MPGDPEKSLLIRAVRQTDKDLQMPPKQKLSAAQIADLVAWVKMGAPDPRKSAPGIIANAQEYGMSLEEGRKFWSFQPIKDHLVPKVKDPSWPRTPSIISSWPASKPAVAPSACGGQADVAPARHV